MHTLGRHLLAELYDCEPNRLDDPDLVRRSMLDVCRAIGATVVGQSFHRFSPHGVSGTLLIAESHFSMHTWPESGYAAADIYTCGELDPHLGLTELARALGGKRMRLCELVRGLPEDIDAHRSTLPADVHLVTQIAKEEPIR